MKSFLRCALVASTALLARSEKDESKCFLRKTSFADGDKGNKFLGSQKYHYRAPKKPFPSLTQCYKNNQRACCVSAHDSYIAGKYGEILSPTCLREYQYLENYFCLGCYPDQVSLSNSICDVDHDSISSFMHKEIVYEGDYLVPDNSSDTTADSPYLLDEDGNGIFTMRICKTFAQNLYDPSRQGSYNYDNCGLLGDEGKGYLPKEKYANYSEFIEAIKPPYFEKVKWKVIDDTQKDAPKCFGAATAIQVGSMSLAFVLLAQFLQ